MSILTKPTRIFFLLALGIIPSVIMAQVGSVNLRCFSENILYWENEESACLFVQHEVFISNSINGPYSAVGLTVDSGQEDFLFSTLPPGQVYFYVMTTSDCPTTSIISSDTISTFPPSLVQIQYLDVLDNGISVVWEDEINPLEDHAYVIYRNTESGTNAIDTVYNSYDFLDTDVFPLEGIETYFVLALNDCGSLSIFDSPLSTVFLSTSYSYCSGDFSLKWNQTERWQDDIAGVELFVEHESGQDSSIVISKDFTEFTSMAFWGDGEYCFELIMDLNSGETFSSNEVCEFVLLPPIIEKYRFTNISQMGSDLVLDWEWSDASGIVSYELSSYNQVEESIWTSGPQDFNAGDITSFTDVNSLINSDQYIEYELLFRDECDSLYRSERFSNVFLELNGAGTTLDFSWTYREVDYLIPDEILIFRVDNIVGDELLGSFPAIEGMGSLDLDVEELKDSYKYFYAIRKARILGDNGLEEVVFSRSNEVSIINELDLVFPNAINPSGLNNVFKPILISGSIQSYNCFIYDRYGKELFNSDSIDEGWNGQLGLEYLPAQVYSFVAQAVDDSGKSYMYKGKITIVK